MVFNGVWAIAKNFVDEKTRKKINIIGGGYKKVLLENIPAENLPDYLGGECPASEFKWNAGPWDNYDFFLTPQVGIRNKETGLFYKYGCLEPSPLPEGAQPVSEDHSGQPAVAGEEESK